MAPKESGTVKQKRSKNREPITKEDAKQPKVGKAVPKKDSDNNTLKEEHNVEDPDHRKKRRKSKTSNGDAEGAADSDEEEPKVKSKKKKPDTITDEKEQKLKKKSSKLAALFSKDTSNDSAETESIIPVHPALEYLTTWKQSQSSWKFQKVRQTWLLLHIYEEDKIPNSYFKILLDYIEDLKGSARVQTVEKATEIHRVAPQEGDDNDDGDDDDKDDDDSSEKKTPEAKEAAAKKRANRKKSERALEVLRVLS